VVGYQYAGVAGGASDFKTLYASAWCFAHNLDAYKVENIQRVFEANHVVLPSLWDGHRPVYPPFTLPLMAPISLLPMVTAAYVWMGLSAALTVCGVVILCRVGRDFFDLPIAWRLSLIALCAAGPLLSFGLEMGNGSVIVTVLCFAAVLDPRLKMWPAALALAVAFLLKPHLAIWILLALLASGETVRCNGSTVALRAMAICAGATAGTAGWLASRHMLMIQIRSYLDVLWSETHCGSMSPAARDVLGVPEQITSLQSAIGYWWMNAYGCSLAALVGCAAVLAILAGIAVALRSQGASSEQKLLFLSCWSGLGMIATYHRAHDGIILLVLAPWVMSRLHRSLKDIAAWAVVACYAAMSWGPTADQLHWLGTWTGLEAAAQVIYYRQGALAMLLLEVLLLALMSRSLVKARYTADGVAADEVVDMTMYSGV
jgi:Glycosyltransferase family 87